MLLEIKDLSVEYQRMGRRIPALRNVSLSINAGETVGIVGESGCGKSTLALALLRLILPHEGQITNGEILWNPLTMGNEKNILSLSEEELRQIRGKEISIIFQDPFSSLNPVLRIGEQIAETVLTHDSRLTTHDISQQVIALLKQVRLPEPERIYYSYPHQISGGQRQRAMIALAIANHPKLLIADEPTTALDVTVQKEILELLRDLQKELGMSILLITHHMGIIAHYTEKIAVLYAGEMMEEGKTAEIISNPQHPYTAALLKTITETAGSRHLSLGYEKEKRFYMIPGAPPDPISLPQGCLFHPRCLLKVSECEIKSPSLRNLDNLNRKVSCHLAPFSNQRIANSE